MLSFLRLTLAVLGLCLLLVSGTLVASYQAQSKITTYFHEDEGVTYPLHIDDTNQHVQLLLAGSRCFPLIPTKSFVTASLNTGRWFSLDDTSAVDAVLRLRCR